MLPYYLFAVTCSYLRIIVANDFSFVEAVRNLMLGIWDLTLLRASGIKTYGLIRATWYLSAMYLSMPVLYLMLRKWTHTFTHVIAPLMAIFLLGYLSQSYGNLNQYVNNWNIFYSGIIRAVAELSLGCVCYAVYERIKDIPFTTFSRILITLAQVAGYGLVIYCAHDLPCKQFDFVLVPILAVCVVLSFSGHGIAAPVFRGPVFPWLGKMSLIIYLNHFWVKDSIPMLFPESLGYWKLLCICICCIFCASLCCLFCVDTAMHLIDRYKCEIRRCFIKNQ